MRPGVGTPDHETGGPDLDPPVEAGSLRADDLAGSQEPPCDCAASPRRCTRRTDQVRHPSRRAVMKTSQWHPMGEPASPAEAEALEAVRVLLPDDAVTHAWANLSFIDLDGRTAEVDLLLLCKAGLFVVELKGWHGRVAGDQQNWRHISPNGNVRHERHPLYATDSKAKRL